jgi:hypothetical protein
LPTVSCDQTRARFDLFHDREMNVAEAALIEQHLASCAGCTAFAEKRESLRLRVRRAVRNVETPPDLAYKVQSAIAQRGASRNWVPALIAVAAALLVTAGAFYFRPEPRDLARPIAVARVSDDVAPVMQIGLRQHVHCGVLREYPEKLPSLLSLARAKGSNPGLIDAVESHVPAGLHVVMAHQCSYEGRQYTHVIARGEGHLMSLLITKRENGDVMANALKAVANELNTPIFAAATQKYSIGAFEASGKLVYLVSDFDAAQNLAALKSMTPQLRAALL